jgi:putative hemolysin
MITLQTNVKGNYVMEPDGSILFQAFILFCLILINAFFAASEIAIISLNDQKVRRQADDGDKKAKLLYHLISEPSRFLATIQVGVTLSGLMASAVASQSFAGELTKILKSVGVPLDEPTLRLLSVIIITVLLSFFSLVLGELVPKRIAMQHPEPISRFSISPLSLINKVAGPFVKLLSVSTNLLLRLFGLNPQVDEEKITEEEIRLMMDVGQEKGVIPTTEKEMIDNIFEFDNTMVSQIMTHRTDLVALPLDATPEDILETVVSEKFSRLPVYDDTIDDIVGILHVQDLIPYLKSRDFQSVKLSSIIRKPYFVPASKMNNELLRELQKNKTHMAIIVDEYGGTSGVVTIEDLLEEIVGNIFDEHDEEIKQIEKLDENTFLIDGFTGLEDVNHVLGINLPTEDFDTLSGFLIGEMGRIPEEGEKPVIELEKVVFKVEEIEDRRIRRVKACKA